MVNPVEAKAKHIGGIRGDTESYGLVKSSANPLSFTAQSLTSVRVPRPHNSAVLSLGFFSASHCNSPVVSRERCLNKWRRIACRAWGTHPGDQQAIAHSLKPWRLMCHISAPMIRLGHRSIEDRQRSLEYLTHDIPQFRNHIFPEPWIFPHPDRAAPTRMR